jgi:hypothetical protein
MSISVNISFLPIFNKARLLTRWDLHQDVTHEENANTSVELNTSHSQVIFQVVQASLRDGIAVNVVQKVHDAQRWLSSR